jgi:MFS family permease
MVVPYVVSALLVPPLGYFAEKVRRRSYLIIINSFFFFLTYLCMLFFETNSHLRGEEFIRWIPVTLMGVGIGMFCSVIVPTLPMLISDKQLGTAFGLMEILMNLFLGLVPLIIGAIRDSVEDNEL